MKRVIFPESVNHRYRIKYPTCGRARYSIVKEQLDLSIKPRFTTVKHPALDALNSSFLAEKISSEIAEKNVREVIERLYKEDGVRVIQVVHNQDNYKVLERYWKAEYEDRDLVDPDTAYHALRRAVEAVGDLPLVSASKDQIQKAINAKYSGNKQRRIVAKLTQILKWLGREDVKLRKNREVKLKVNYLTESDFKKILQYLPSDEIRLLHQVCFYTGCRIGEAFDLDIARYNPKTSTIKVLSQVDKQGQSRETKNRRERTAFVFPQGAKYFEEWVRVRHRIDFKTRDRMARITRAACRKAFANDASKHLKFHDLRHSYAIALLGKGVSITLVAQSIGDSVVVCQKHYIGFELATESVELINQLVRAKPLPD